MNRLLLLLAIGFGFAQCKQPVAAPDPEPASVTYNRSATKIMTELKPRLIGTWTFQRVRFKPREYSYATELSGLQIDTTQQNLATITLQQALKLRDTPDDPRTPQFDGTIQFRGKTYPIYMRTRANAEQVVKGTGYVAVVYFEFNFPSGPLPNDPEFRFLDAARLSDYYSLEIGADGKTMTWKAFNDGFNRVELQKQ